jgi:alkylation response protein AidB-like acyl-CoA dehydrogenase
LTDVHATVRHEGENYVLNGTKRAVLHGAQSSPRMAIARLEGTSGIEGLRALMLPTDVAGVQVSKDALKLGLIATPSASYVCENVQVAETCMLGKVGDSGVIRAATLYNILRAGVACGTARAALEYAMGYAKERVAFGRPIVSYQGIAFMISEMAMKLDAVRLLVWRAATSWDHDEDIEALVKQAEAAQHQAIEIAKSATTDAVQILGGAGFLQDHPAEMWMRNAAAME